MSNPTRRRPAALSRREVLRGMACSSLVLPLAACNSSSRMRAPAARGESLFQHGVASGDPLADRVILWTRISVSEPTPVQVEVARDAAFNVIVFQRLVQATATTDYTLKVDAEGLAPGQFYFYRFRSGSDVSPTGRTRTAPAGEPERLRLALVSCSNYANGFFNPYRVLAERELDAVVHVGDYLYENGTVGTLGRAHEPPFEILSLEDYRERHAQYRRDPDLQAMTAAHPLIVTWDDHESANNSWIDGAQNHQPDTEGDWNERKRVAARAYAEWLPIRLPDPSDPLRIWRRQTYGDLVDLFVLDTRLQRNAPETDVTLFGAEANDPARSMLGAPQREWLLAGLDDSHARGIRWRVLAQQTMISPHRSSPDLSLLPLPYLPPALVESAGLRQGGGNEGRDNWGAYIFERDMLMRHLRDGGISNNVVLSGDIHTAWATDVVEDAYTPFNPLSASLTGAPGYNPLTGQGSVAVEFTSMSVTSNNFADMDGGAQVGQILGAAGVAGNPNVHYWNPATHGFVLIDITRDRLTGEFWDTGTALEPLAPGADAVRDAAWFVDHLPAGRINANHLRRA
ncbi:MAG: alkaline phosphatase D family protein [Oceanococcaceae bacterium]